jgi:hypothetical protein
MMMAVGHTNGQAHCRFGYNVDIYWDIIIVGAALHSTTGAVYIYSRQDGGNWTHAVKTTASDGAEGDQFGYSVAASEDLVIVGTYESSWDAVYIFEKDVRSGNWKETTKHLTSAYSTALSVTGDVFSVGTLNSRSVTVYERNETDSSWAQTMTLTSPSGSNGHGFSFGNSVSVDGDVMIVGAPYLQWF